jgi:hypothetical protein
MAATITIYDSFTEAVGDGRIDLDTDTFKVALLTSSYTPSMAHDQYEDLTNQLSTANGYTAGGATLGSVTWAQTSGSAKFDAADVVWTASGAGITARYAVIYDDTATGKELVAYILLDDSPADVTATAGNTLTLTFSASGIFTLAKA